MLPLRVTQPLTSNISFLIAIFFILVLPKLNVLKLCQWHFAICLHVNDNNNNNNNHVLYRTIRVAELGYNPYPTAQSLFFFFVMFRFYQCYWEDRFGDLQSPEQQVNQFVIGQTPLYRSGGVLSQSVKLMVLLMMITWLRGSHTCSVKE